MAAIMKVNGYCKLYFAYYFYFCKVHIAILFYICKTNMTKWKNYFNIQH